jgi:hypothetical protein
LFFNLRFLAGASFLATISMPSAIGLTLGSDFRAAVAPFDLGAFSFGAASLEVFGVAGGETIALLMSAKPPFSPIFLNFFCLQQGQ